MPERQRGQIIPQKKSVVNNLLLQTPRLEGCLVPVYLEAQHILERQKNFKILPHGALSCCFSMYLPLIDCFPLHITGTHTSKIQLNSLFSLTWNLENPNYHNK